MPWWSRANSPSSSSSSPIGSPSTPSSAAAGGGKPRKEIGSLFSRKGSTAGAGELPRLTRQRKIRHLANIVVANIDGTSPTSEHLASTPVSRSPSNFDGVAPPTRSSSSPLPLPRPEQQSPTRRVVGFSPGGCRLPSPRERGGGGDEGTGTGTAAAAGGDWSSESAPTSKLTYQPARQRPELVGASSGISLLTNCKKALQDPNPNETETFRLNIPAKSAPVSGFSSPVLSPRRLSNVEYGAYNFSQGVWSVAETFTLKGSVPPLSNQISQQEFSPDRLSLYSPNSKSPAVRSRNQSAPPSPLHPKLQTENLSSWHDNNNANVHPLPLPPGAAPSQSSFPHPNTAKPEPSPWKKQQLIGSGTFGNVYVGINRHTGAQCAMKEVNIIPDDPKSIECLKQLEQEIKVLSTLQHRNIVQYYGSEMTEDHFYIYLEYVYPGSINKYVRDHYGAMTESVVRNFTRHILEGLAYLHGSNNIHRDIKGANLLVDINGVVKLADFGMAKHLSGAAGALSLKGTPHWMAPEVVRATMNKEIGYDYAVDIWSLGCTIIEMFTGKHPWCGLEGPQAMFKVLYKDPPIPDRLSSEGKDFLKQCFRRNPADRPTAKMLLEHPFIRNSHHHKIHGSLQAFAGIKTIDNTYSPRDRTKAKSETCTKGKHLPNGKAIHFPPETSESGSSRVCPHSMPEGVPNLFAHANHPLLSPPGSPNISNGVLLGTRTPQPYALPRPNGKAINFF